MMVTKVTSKPEASFMDMGRGVFGLVIPVPPVPASRPRVGRWGTYYGKRYKKWLADANAALAPITTEHAFDDAYCSVRAEMVCAPLKTVKREVPRGDVDNFIKGPLDVITKAGILWKDDDLVRVLTVSKRFAKGNEQPHTYLAIEKER